MNDTILHEEFTEEPFTTKDIIEHLQEKRLRLLSELNVVEQAIKEHISKRNRTDGKKD
jgi:hypothetical protein